MTYDPNQPGQYPQWPPPQPPYYAPPPAMLAYSTPVAPARPTSALVLSIIGIVLASLWILVGLMGIFQLIFAITMMRSVLSSKMGGFETVLRIQAFEGVLAGIIGVALLTVSIACLRLVSWARRGMIIVAIVDLVFIIAKVILTITWLIPQQMSAMSSMSPMPAAGMNPFAGAQTAIAAGQAILTAIYPIFVLVFMTKPRMKQVYDLQRF